MQQFIALLELDKYCLPAAWCYDVYRQSDHEYAETVLQRPTADNQGFVAATKPRSYFPLNFLGNEKQCSQGKPHLDRAC